jgi:hypothetical protein
VIEIIVVGSYADWELTPTEISQNIVGGPRKRK